MEETVGSLEVVVLSTYLGVEAHREIAIRAITAAGLRAVTLDPDPFESGGIEVSLDAIARADIVLLILGYRYGHKAESLAEDFHGRSILEIEYEEAVRRNKPIIAFVMSPDHPVQLSDIETDPGKLERLTAFRLRILERQNVRLFGSTDKFREGLVQSLATLKQDLNANLDNQTESIREKRPATGEVLTPRGGLPRDHQPSPQTWIFYQTERKGEVAWINSLRAGDTIFWRHGSVSGGGAYRKQLQRGDTILVLVEQELIASGVLLAGEELRFVDSQNRICRPVRIIDRFSRPLDRRKIEASAGSSLVRQGAVHPVSGPALDAINAMIAAEDSKRPNEEPFELPYPPDLAKYELTRRPLRADLETETDIRPDLPTARTLGWTAGVVWRQNEDEEVHGRTANEATSQDVLRGQTPDMDARIPFVLDAPSDTEDQLERGPFALFLAQRLHLIWCQMNGHAPDGRGGRTVASPQDTDTFIVHVDSPWGGGKTTFANFIARVLDPREQRLTPRHFLRSSLAATTPDEELSEISLDEVFVPSFARAAPQHWTGARRPWIVGRYNAWRDQYVQPPWWQVFLTIQNAIVVELRREGWAQWRQAWRDGAPLRYLSGAALLLRAFRVGFQRFWYQVWNRKLQAQIGLLLAAAVIVALLALLGAFEGLTKGTYEPKKVGEWLALGAAVLGLGGFSLAALITVVSQSLAPDLDFSAEHKQIGVQDPISRFRRAFHRILRATNRPVLLVVDDLDRCEPRAVVELMRGFQTIIRSPRLFVLLLGDRAWIENAHDVHHKELAGLREGEGSLGARFVQKVIQLSFRLPTIKPDARARFARGVLGDGDIAAADDVANVLRQVDARVSGIVEQAGSVGSREAEVARAIETARTTLAKQVTPAQAEEAVNLAEQLANVKLVAAAGADTAQQRSVFNSVTQLVGSLPNNPRQIKRIFMAFATYEVVGRVYFGYQLTEEGADGPRRARRWRQLAMWVTLAIEWPETWRAIARRPAILRAAYANGKARTSAERQLLAGVADAEKPAFKELIERLRSDRNLRAMLTVADPTADKDSSFGATEMEVEAVYEFNHIIWEPGFEFEPSSSNRGA